MPQLPQQARQGYIMPGLASHVYKKNQYIFVAYFYSLNAIIVRPMENQTDECMVATFKDIIDYLSMQPSAIFECHGQ